MNACNCANFEHLSLDSGSIYKRLAQTRSFLPNLQLIAEHQDGKRKLFRCPVCAQNWQLDKAWLWNNVEYAFKIPDILPDEWLKELYISPDEMTTYNKYLREFIDEQNFTELDLECNDSGCSQKAISLSVKCLYHHIKRMQQKGILLSKPEGKMCFPYNYSEKDFSFFLS